MQLYLTLMLVSTLWIFQASSEPRGKSRHVKTTRDVYTSVHIAIMTGWNDYTSRQDIRKSWLTFRGNYSYTFIVGKSSANQPLRRQKRMSQLDKEMKTHNDILIGDFTDSYYNLTRKAVTMLTLHNKADFIFKADVDTYVNIPHLLRYISVKKNTSVQYAGRIVKELLPNRDVHARWYMPLSSWPSDKPFPDFAQGQGYLLHSTLAKCMQRVVEKDWPEGKLDFPLEDVFIGVLANRCGVIPNHLVSLAQYAKEKTSKRSRNISDELSSGEVVAMNQHWIYCHRKTESEILVKLLELAAQ